jgi:hypothetical protein
MTVAANPVMTHSKPGTELLKIPMEIQVKQRARRLLLDIIRAEAHVDLAVVVNRAIRRTNNKMLDSIHSCTVRGLHGVVEMQNTVRW